MPTRKIAIEYIWEIDEKFAEAIKNKWQRTGVEWGKWSHDMNRRSSRDLEPVVKIKDAKYFMDRLEAGKIPVAQVNNISFLVFKYWLNRSALLEMHNAGQWFRFIKKHKLNSEAADIRKRLLKASKSESS